MVDVEHLSDADARRTLPVEVYGFTVSYLRESWFVCWQALGIVVVLLVDAACTLPCGGWQELAVCVGSHHWSFFGARA